MIRDKVDSNITDKVMKKLYLESLFSTRVLFTGYSMWIEKEVTSWEGWKGNLEDFNPGGKHFDRFISYILQRNNMKKTKKLKEVLDGTEGN